MRRKGIGGRLTKKDSLDFVKAMTGKSEHKKKRSYAARIKKNDMREKRLEREIVHALRLRGHDVTKNGEQSTYNSHLIMNGIADLSVFTDRGIVFLEVKHGTNWQTGRQPEFQDMCRRHGIAYHIVRSVGDAIEALK